MSMVILSSAIASGAAYNILYPELLLKSVTKLSINVLKGIYNLISISNDNELQKILLTTDIVNDINIIKSFIDNSVKDRRLKDETIMTCIKNVNETLEKLEINICFITKKINLNKTIWLSYFRSHDTADEREQIIFLINQLKHRFDLLINLLIIQKK